jgi:hypothetical protein
MTRDTHALNYLKILEAMPSKNHCIHSGAKRSVPLGSEIKSSLSGHAELFRRHLRGDTWYAMVNDVICTATFHRDSSCITGTICIGENQYKIVFVSEKN